MSSLNENLKNSIKLHKEKIKLIEEEKNKEIIRYYEEINVQKGEFTKSLEVALKRIYFNFINIKSEKNKYLKRLESHVEDYIKKNPSYHKWVIPKLDLKVENELLSEIEYPLFSSMKYHDHYPYKQLERFDEIILALKNNIFFQLVEEINSQLVDFKLYIEYDKSKKDCLVYKGGYEYVFLNDKYSSQNKLGGNIIGSTINHSKIDHTSILPNPHDFYGNSFKIQTDIKLLKHPPEIKHEFLTVKSFFDKNVKLEENILLVDKTFVNQLTKDKEDYSRKIANRKERIKKINRENRKRKKEINKIVQINSEIGHFFMHLNKVGEVREYYNFFSLNSSSDFPEISWFEQELSFDLINESCFTTFKTKSNNYLVIIGKENNFNLFMYNKSIFKRSYRNIGLFDIISLKKHFSNKL